MDAKLQRVIDLAAQLQDAISECECVLGYSTTKFRGVRGGIHVYEPDKLGFSGLEFERTDKDGNDWVKTSVGGVCIFGRLRKESQEVSENESS